MEDQTADDAQRLGIAPPTPQAPREYAVWEEHWQALQVFLACRTQWRIIAGMAGAQHQGLDYPAVESVMRMRGVEDTAQVLGQLQQIEAGALEVLNS